MLSDLKIYKLAKDAAKDMPGAIAAVEKSLVSLMPYRRFRAVAQAMAALLQHKATLQHQLNVAKDTIQKKARLG